MKRVAVIGAAAAVATAAGGVGYWWYDQYRQPPEVRICIEEVKARLKAPATFSLTEAENLPASIEEWSRERLIELDAKRHVTSWRAMRLPTSEEQARAEAAKLLEEHPFFYTADTIATAQVILTFDAANTYGTPVRHLAGCSFYQLMFTGKIRSWEKRDIYELVVGQR